MLPKVREYFGNKERVARGVSIVDNSKLRELKHIFKGKEGWRDSVRFYFDDLELRADLLESKMVLDIGAADSPFDKYCKVKYSSKVFTIDIDKDNLGNKHKLGAVADATKLPFRDETFDTIISHASMPHILVPLDDDSGNFVPLVGEIREKVRHQLRQLFSETYRVLKHGGQIRFSTFSTIELKHLNERKMKLPKGMKMSQWQEERDDLHNQQVSRVALIKEVLQEFEIATGCRCMFKDEKHGGLIIIQK